MTIYDASHYLYTSKLEQKIKQKSSKQKSCDVFNVGRSLVNDR